MFVQNACLSLLLNSALLQDPKTIENFKHVGDSDDPLNERCFQIVTADQKFTENQFYNFMAFTKEDCKVNGYLNSLGTFKQSLI